MRSERAWIDGSGRLAIRTREIEIPGQGTTVAAELLVDGAPIMTEHDALCGSVERILRYANPEHLEVDLAFLRDAVSGLPVLGSSLRASFAPLLHLFAPGWYTLSLETLGYWRSIDLEATAPNFDWRNGIEHYTDCTQLLLPTRISEHVDEARVNCWRERVLAGERPVLLLARLDHVCYAVLDGHHKLRGYGLENIEPLAVVIAPG